MKIKQVSLDNCAEVSGTVVVIDVIRAFSTAAYAFAAGALEILLVGTVEEALETRTMVPGAWVMGEVGGLKPEGFDFGNSPYEISLQDFSGRRLIQRTSAGTQGIVRSIRAERLLASSFVCARATAELIKRISPESVTFVISGVGPDGRGDEDAACAEYIETLLRGKTFRIQNFVDRVRKSPPGRAFSPPQVPEEFAFDLEYCLDVDRFHFAMQVQRGGGMLVMRPVYI